MITDVILSIISYFFKLLIFILPQWSIYPDSVLIGLSYFFGKIATLNFIFPIDTLFAVILFLIQFEASYYTAKIVIYVFHFLRGTGNGIDI